MPPHAGQTDTLERENNFKQLVQGFHVVKTKGSEPDS